MFGDWNLTGSLVLLLHGGPIGLGADDAPILVIPALLFLGLAFLALAWPFGRSAIEDERANEVKAGSRHKRR